MINAHEHVQSRTEARELLGAMDESGIEATVLLGSPWFTFTLDPEHGLTGCDWNNDEILWLAREYRGRFHAWPTLQPNDPSMLEKLESLIERGASGLKLYLGHGYRQPGSGEFFFHTMPLDDERMFPVYARCEKAGLPLCFHVNCGGHLPFRDELVHVLESFPALRVNVPHWMLLTSAPDTLDRLLDAHPNLFTDVSFGHDTYLVAGLRRISRTHERLQEIVRKHRHRIFFGTDTVLSAAPHKNRAWFKERARVYRTLLEASEFETPLVPGKVLRGLALEAPVLDAIFRTNFERLTR